MAALQLGPLAFPIGPLLWLGALLLAQALASRLGGPQARAAADTVWLAALAGFAAARAAYVARAADAYLAAPWSVLDIRDGGWSPWAGAAAALALLAWRAWRAPGLRRALGVAAAAALLFWAAASALLGVHQRPELPALALAAPDGRSAELRELAHGQPTVINLWASWCAPCRTELPAFAAAQAAAGGVRFLYVNQGEDAATVQRFLAAQPFSLDAVWLDRGAQLGPAVGSRGLPTTLFVDAHGRIVERHFGMLNAAALAVRLRRL
ncbi:MAG TPA: TlpA disulfide reductase family protein [Rubrivivax sp.]|nr:TlpA disulfide reductase family protein [Rubrivivax sp.]